jgi:hypothetical protein
LNPPPSDTTGLNKLTFSRRPDSCSMKASANTLLPLRPHQQPKYS